MTHSIPDSHWPNEILMYSYVTIRRAGTRILSGGHFPTVGSADLKAQRSVCRCGSLDSTVCCDPPANLKWPRGPEGLQKLQLTLARLGIPSKPGPIERLATLSMIWSCP